MKQSMQLNTIYIENSLFPKNVFYNKNTFIEQIKKKYELKHFQETCRSPIKLQEKKKK